MTAMVSYALLTYLLAAIPFGLVVTTLYGGDVDIRAAGSGNIGASNVARLYGWRLAGPVLALDLLKGLVPVLVARLLWPQTTDLWLCVVVFVAFVGHCWPVYLEFRGGKGVATGGGALLGLLPVPAAAGFGLWFGVLLITGRASVAALAASAGVVGLTAWLRPDLLLAVVLLAALVGWRHLANIRRLMSGEEEEVLRPVRWGRRARADTAEEVLQQGPSGGAEAPPVWREKSDPLEVTEEG